MKNEIQYSHTSNSEVNKILLIWICSISVSLLVYLIATLLITSYYHPNIELLKANAVKILLSSINVRPEPVEAMLFRTAIILIPGSLLISYKVFSKNSILQAIAQKPVSNLIIIFFIILVTSLVYIDFISKNPFASGGTDIPQIDRDDRGGSNFDFYFGDLFLSNYLLLYSLFIVPLISSLFFIGFKKYNWQKSRLFQLCSNIAGYTFISCLILACILMCTFKFPYTVENKYDFGAVYYSMTQVYAGLPLLVNGFTNTYGLYPHFLNPLFQIIGLDVFKFSMVMSLVMGLSYTLNFYCLKQIVSNKILLFTGMTTIIFFTLLDFEFTENFDANFALHSIRYIIPSTLLFLITLYLKKRSIFIYWSTYLIMALFVLWNPEFGIISYISWIMFNAYTDFYGEDGKPAFKKILLHLGYGIVLLISAIYTFKFLVFLIYGASPDMSALWTSIQIFGNLGFNLLPMTLIHPWNIEALIIILGFVYAISKLHIKDRTPEASIVFFLSVMSTGIFIYFQGRSHNWNLVLSAGMALILLTVLGDKLWTITSKKNNLSLSALFLIFIYITSISFFEIITHTTKIFDLISQESEKTKNFSEQRIIEKSRDYFLDNTQPGQKVYVFTLKKCQALFIDGSKRISAFNPGMIDLAFISDINRLENQILDSSFSACITPGTFENMPFMSRPLAAVAATYTYSKNKDGIYFAEKRKIRIPSTTFFNDSLDLLFHRKYTDDHAGSEARVNDALGVAQVSLTQSFSAEILFYSIHQVFPLATLVGNSDSTGFLISTKSDKFIFGFNGKGYILPLPLNKWVYCVVNVFPDHFEIFENGIFVYSHALVRPLIKQDGKLYIGNLGYMNYYTGAIAEVGITDKPMDSLQIKRNWNVINSAIARSVNSTASY